MTNRTWRLPSIASALWLGAAVLPATVAPAAAGSVYLDGTGVGGAALSLKVESFQEQKFKTTVAQKHDFSCGSAALATMLSHNYNIPVTEDAVFQDMFENGDKQVIGESGFSLLDMKNYLARHGLESNGYRAPLAKLASVGVPVIVLLNVRGYRHFVVFEGIQDGWVLLSDPANGTRTEQVGVFEEEWSGVFFLILSDADQAQASFNSPQRWAVAPRPPWVLARYAIDLNTLAQPAMLGLGRF